MMKRTDAGLQRRVTLALVATLLVTMVFAGAVSAKPAEPLAPDVPNGPHCFWGTVTTTRGIGMPGATVVARKVAGFWTGQVTSTANIAAQYNLCVPGYDSSTGLGAKPGDLIGFYVNGVLAALYDVATGRTYSSYVFQYFGGTQLNLAVPVQETINASAGPNCTIDPAGAVRVDFGTNQTFTFGAAAGYQVYGAFVDGVANPAAVTAGAYTFTNVRESHSIGVTCIKSTWTITPTAGEGCTIAPSGPQLVNVFDDIMFTVGAETGYTLTDVTVDGTSKGPLTEVVFTNVMADHTLSASCTRQSFMITPSAGAGGKIEPGTPQTVLFGDDVIFSIVADPGFIVEDVLVNGVSVGAVNTYTFQDVAANGTISATFKAASFKLFMPFIAK